MIGTLYHYARPEDSIDRRQTQMGTGKSLMTCDLRFAIYDFRRTAYNPCLHVARCFGPGGRDDGIEQRTNGNS